MKPRVKMVPMADRDCWTLPSAREKSKKEEDKDTTDIPHPAPGFVEDGLDSLRKYVCTFLRDGQNDKLLFDSKFGGMVTMDGLEDTQADFGNGRFNVRSNAEMLLLNWFC
jgi:hypothetical protein